MLPILVIIAKQGFQDKELASTREELIQAGFMIKLSSTETGPCTGKFGSTETAEIALRDVNIDAYDRIVYIGGPGAEPLRDDADALRIARQTVKAGKILAAICIAPTILAVAGALKGKRATVWDSGGQQMRFIESFGAIYTGQTVTVDGNIITGNGPGASHEFGSAVARA